MEVLAQTEYQDVYRVTDGVLLIVNKFVDMFNKKSSIYDRRKRKMYHKNTKDLTINQEDRVDFYNNFISKGTVLYHNYPVIVAGNKTDWRYEVKTTGSALGGDFNKIENLLNDILCTIRTGDAK